MRRFNRSECNRRYEIKARVIIVTKSEEFNIKECIESVKEFSEVLVIDSNSSDSTRAIAHSLGAQIV